MPSAEMIAIDWGTSSFRAYRLEARRVVERRETALGISTLVAGGFEAALRGAVGDWLSSRVPPRVVLMAGMIGSRQGWVEAGYVACPAGADELAAGLTPVSFDGARVAIVPGVRSLDADGVPEVMRGEESQLAGLVAETGGDMLACLPGTHSKWAIVKGGRVENFATHMTGELFAAIRGHTIVGRMIADGPVVEAAFLDGVARAQAAGGLLHHVFGVRTLGLFGRLGELEASSYLSGLLIGHEIAAAAPSGTVHLIGAPALCHLYGLALQQSGVASVMAPPDIGAAGLALIAERAGWV